MSERTVIASCNTGLAERLVVMAGAVRIARKLNRVPFQFWPTDDAEYHVRCRAEELFDALPIRTFEHESPRMVFDVSTLIYEYGRNGSTPLFKINPNAHDHQECIMLKGHCCPRFNGETFWDMKAELHAICAEITVKDHLVKKAAAFAGTISAPLVVGVHVRREVRQQHDCRFEMSKYEHYFRLIRTALERDTVIFLATDKEEVVRVFAGEFGNKIITYPKTDFYRMDLAGMEQALIELLILSWCDIIIGCNGSHFSVFPAIWGNKPFITACSRTAGSARGYLDDLFSGKQPSDVMIHPDVLWP